MLARSIAQWLIEELGQPFVVDNKPGAGNNIGTEFVVNAPPDGDTLLPVNPANSIDATLYWGLNFNFVRDIAPVAGPVRTAHVMEVTAKVPARRVAGFIADCKANPGKINMASSGSGTSVHLSGEWFKSMTGCDMLHVPCKGAGPALTDLIGGQVHVMFDKLPSSAGHIKAGRLRALADPRMRKRLAERCGRNRQVGEGGDRLGRQGRVKLQRPPMATKCGFSKPGLP